MYMYMYMYVYVKCLVLNHKFQILTFVEKKTVKTGPCMSKLKEDSRCY